MKQCPKCSSYSGEIKAADKWHLIKLLHGHVVLSYFRFTCYRCSLVTEYIKPSKQVR